MKKKKHIILISFIFASLSVKIVLVLMFGFLRIIPLVAVLVLFFYPGKNDFESVLVLDNHDFSSYCYKSEYFSSFPSVIGFGLWMVSYKRQGVFKMPKNASGYDILRSLFRHKYYVRSIHLRCGANNAEILYKLHHTPGFTGSLTLLDMPAHGSLMMDTYYYKYGTKRKAFIEKLSKEMIYNEEKIVKKYTSSVYRKLHTDTLHTDAWHTDILYTDASSGYIKRSVDKKNEFSNFDMIILASILPLEAELPEYFRIACVFFNRLRSRMPLQSDATLLYLDKWHAGYAGNVHKAIKSEFNTYKNRGLPPQPIAHVCKQSLIAVYEALHNNDSVEKELYFVSDGNGGHIFAKNYKNHLLNVKKYRLTRQYKSLRDKFLECSGKNLDRRVNFWSVVEKI